MPKNLFDNEDDNNRGDSNRFPLERTIFMAVCALIAWFAGWLFLNVSEMKTQMTLFEYRLNEIDKKVTNISNNIGTGPRRSDFTIENHQLTEKRD